MNMCLENTALLTAERNVAGVKRQTHCRLRGEEEGPVKWHHLGTSCIAGHGATGTKPRKGDALQMCPAHFGASGHAALSGLWQELLVEWGWQRLWREACAGPVPELKSRGRAAAMEPKTGQEQRVPSPQTSLRTPQSSVAPDIVFAVPQIQ